MLRLLVHSLSRVQSLVPLSANLFDLESEVRHVLLERLDLRLVGLLLVDQLSGRVGKFLDLLVCLGEFGEEFSIVDVQLGIDLSKAEVLLADFFVGRLNVFFVDFYGSDWLD